MLQMRLAGELAEAQAFLDALASAGVEVAAVSERDRGGFVHVYTTIRMPGFASAPQAARTRVAATAGRVLEGRRRPR
jgi:hypothetical protein